MKNIAQKTFEECYITSTEIAEEVGVSRPSVLNARRRGTLPNAISVGDDRIYIWDRQQVRPYIDNWKAQREVVHQ
jgi:predicted DNA-binding transcriptional regulator AlpA